MLRYCSQLARPFGKARNYKYVYVTGVCCQGPARFAWVSIYFKESRSVQNVGTCQLASRGFSCHSAACRATSSVIGGYFMFSSVMEWTNDKVIQLIDMYRDRPVLWDCRLKDFRDRSKRIGALLEIVVRFGVEKDEIERKIKNLVCHFSRELKREREGIKSGASSDDAYKSKWFCYDSMLFLKNRNRPRRMTDSHNQVVHTIFSLL